MNSRLSKTAGSAKWQILAACLVVFVAGCGGPGEAGMGRRLEQAGITPKKVGTAYQFKTWSGAPVTYSLQLQGVAKTSAVLGPDFSVHYFTFAPEASIALYNGGHPKKRIDNAESRFDAPFGEKQTEWTISRVENAFRAEAFVSDDDSIWHVIVIAPTDQRVRAVIGQLGSFSRRVASESKRAK